MNPQFWWFLTRASGIVAWLMLTASVIWGIVLSTKAFPETRRPAWLLDLHRWLGGLTVSFVVIHLVALVADSYVQFDLVDLAVPFASAWKPLAVALGCRRHVAARRGRSDVAGDAAVAPQGLAGDPLLQLRRLPARQPPCRLRRQRPVRLALPGDRCRIDRRCRLGNGVPAHPSPPATRGPSQPGIIAGGSAAAPAGRRVHVSTHPPTSPTAPGVMMLAIDTLFGLPAHPLVVHAAVILLPIAAVSLVVVAAIPKARRIYAPIVFAVALFATIAVFMAQESGEALEEQVDETELVEEHTEQGETVLPWAIAVTIMSAVVAAEPYARNKLGKVSPHVVTAILVGGSLIVGIGATWTVVEVGHSGAKSVWNDVSEDG